MYLYLDFLNTSLGFARTARSSLLIYVRDHLSCNHLSNLSSEPQRHAIQTFIANFNVNLNHA